MFQNDFKLEKALIRHKESLQAVQKWHTVFEQNTNVCCFSDDYVY